MAIRIVRLGTPRLPGEGLRLGTVRRPPRGIAKARWAEIDFFDVWLPALAPSEELLSWAHHEALSEARWTRFAQRFRKEMTAVDSRQLLALLAALSRRSDFSVGCYCADESRCHRTLLRELFEAAG